MSLQLIGLDSVADHHPVHDRPLPAVISNGTQLCPQGRASAARTVRATVHAVLEQLEPAPALVVNHLTDLLAWNDGYDRLVRPLGVLDGDEPNLLWFTFADDRARAAYLDWDDVADEQVAHIHGLRRGDPDTVIRRTDGQGDGHRAGGQASVPARRA